jgi:hypothetical protein
MSDPQTPATSIAISSSPLLRFRTGTLFEFDPAGSGVDQSLHRPKYKAAFAPPCIALAIFITALRREGVKANACEQE